jgi:uncharacterized protein YqeY
MNTEQSQVKSKLQEDMKQAMRSKEKERLEVVRMALAAIKQKEIDDRVVLSDEQIFSILEKLVKQRKESIEMFRVGGREDLVNQEAFAVTVLQAYLPQLLSEQETESIVADVIAELHAKEPLGTQDMGKVIAAVKAKVVGRADMAVVSRFVKAGLSRVGG